MDKKELEMQVGQVVENLFNEKEEAEIRRRTEAELQKAAISISELTSALETKNAEAEEYEIKLSASESSIQSLITELEAAKEELETANTKLSETTQVMENLNKDIAAEKRIIDLEKAGVARSDKDSQLAKVREMTDEDFASYKEELTSIRRSVMAELEKTRKQAEEDAAKKKSKTPKPDEEDLKEGPEGDDNDPEDLKEGPEPKTKKIKKKKANLDDEEEEEDPPPVLINPGHAAMASLNMEYLPNKDIMSKYRKMGEAMAERWKKKE